MKEVGSSAFDVGTIDDMPRVSSGPTPGVFFNGDNLAVLKFIPDESVDLVYLDPPFNSQRSYNAIFKGARAQERAFKDCWSWEDDAAKTYERLVAGGHEAPAQLVDLMLALRKLLGAKDLMAYLTMMSVRLVQMRRVLKPTGSLYLHCDPTASHYLKLLLDAIFGEEAFSNELIWKRTTAHSSAKKYAPVHDVLLYYRRGATCVWNQPRLDYEDEYLDKYYKFDDGDGRLYWRADLCAAGVRHGRSGVPWRGIDVAAKGMHWKFTVDRLEELDREGRIYWPPRGTMPQYKRYRDELPGRAVGDIWDDVNRINPVGSERTGYPTQKPLALLKRIIEASSNRGDLVLDPFCGCGTTVEAAQRLGRRWIGIDIADVAVDIVRERIESKFPGLQYGQHFVPSDVATARRLAAADRQNHTNEFQWWALSLIGAYAPNSTTSRGKSGADRGVDGEIHFHTRSGGRGKAIVSVKSGGANARDVRDLGRVVDRDRATLGVFITLNQPTKPMETEALECGFIDGPSGEKIRKLQILTIEEIMEGGARARLPGDLIKPQSLPPPFAMPALQAAMFEIPPAAAVPKVPTKRARRPKQEPGIPYRPFDAEPLMVREPPAPAAREVRTEAPGLKRASTRPRPITRPKTKRHAQGD